ncbi:MAG TPA: glycosyltransferase [Holophagaceae bacterium]|nr:glycosyltransferase [Holophagaceae bacterium]
MSSRTRILFLIPSLVPHGAERQLCELVRTMDPERFELHVAVFYGAEDVGGVDLSPELSGLPHVTLHDLRKRRGALGYLQALPRLLALARRVDPVLLHGYMDGNLPMLLIGRLLGKPVVWGIRRTSRDLRGLGWTSRALMSLHAALSRFVDLVIFNSQAGLRNHEAMGLRGRRAVVIPNGFDVARFAPDSAKGALQRAAWGLPAEGAPVIGIVGRISPVKDHPTFLRAAQRIAAVRSDARFVCVGGGASHDLEPLKELAASLGLTERILWAGASGEMASVYNALSVLVLSSRDEGFPNVLGEAMACGVPCVSTEVGDAALLVGEAGMAVAVADDAALAGGVLTLLQESEAAREGRSRAARERICGEFSVATLARRTEAALMDLMRGEGAPFRAPGDR